ncbi:GspH/FimT family pseudopilin [Rheinheimera muenzenbergensis]|uniref:Type II secretion system protein H n=1 Tax=Rheinheimera muenzenbergensis TaxID=1193628 RepID=A0ABU8C9R6_9GAMM
MTKAGCKKARCDKTQKAIETGFTLVELMVTVAVLSVVLTVAVPSFAALVQGNRLTGQVNQIVAALNLAKAEAVKLNRAVLFCHSSDATTCSEPANTGWQGWLVGIAQPRPATGIVVGNIMAVGELHSDQIMILEAESIADSDGEIRFVPQGLVRDQGNVPLTSVLRVCLKFSGVMNIRDIGISSGGQVDVVNSTNTLCAVPEEII